jgi:hypothetical protein
MHKRVLGLDFRKLPKAPVREIRPEKGEKGGRCNVTACQQPGAIYYNSVMRKYYCPHCAREINKSAVAGGQEPFCTLDEEAKKIHLANLDNELDKYALY